MAISGDTLVVGAWRNADAGSESGSAYVFVGLRTEEEVQGLTVEGADPTTVSWTDQGAGVVYDVAGGLISELRPAGGVAGAECLEEDAPTASHVDSRLDPPAGEGYYYIVRAQHACTGTYGYASSKDERIPTSACD